MIRRAPIVMLTVAALAACGGSGKSGASSPGSTRRAPSSTTAAAATTTTVGPLTYSVRPGDTLTRLAKQFRVSVSTIVSANHLANPDRLTAGQVLVIPPAPPRQLTVLPARGAPGDSFRFAVTGAMPGETVTFTIESPAGKYTGGPHTASTDGSVTATYDPGLDACGGRYAVSATGDAGTSLRATFVVATSPSSGPP